MAIYKVTTDRKYDPVLGYVPRSLMRDNKYLMLGTSYLDIVGHIERYAKDDDVVEFDGQKETKKEFFEKHA